MTYYDDFNRSLLGNAPNGQPWQLHGGGSWSIVSNQLAVSMPNAFAFCIAEWFAADVDLAVDAATDPVNDAGGVVVRWEDASNWIRWCGDSFYSGGSRYLQFCIGGVITDEVTVTGLGTPGRLRLRAVGNAYECYDDGTLVATYTDPLERLTYPTLHGVMFFSRTRGQTYDNFELSRIGVNTWGFNLSIGPRGPGFH